MPRPIGSSKDDVILPSSLAEVFRRLLEFTKVVEAFNADPSEENFRRMNTVAPDILVMLEEANRQLDEIKQQGGYSDADSDAQSRL